MIQISRERNINEACSSFESFCSAGTPFSYLNSFTGERVVASYVVAVQRYSAEAQGMLTKEGMLVISCRYEKLAHLLIDAHDSPFRHV